MLYFYTDAQGMETRQQTRVCLLHKCTECLRHMIFMQMQIRHALSRPILGQYGRHTPEEIFTRLTRGDSAKSVNRTIIHAGIVFCCMGQLMTLYALAMFLEAPYLNLQYVATHICNSSTKYPQAKLHECIRCYFAFKKMCWSSHLDISITHRIESLMFEIVARWEAALENIEQAAKANKYQGVQTPKGPLGYTLHARSAISKF